MFSPRLFAPGAFYTPFGFGGASMPQASGFKVEVDFATVLENLKEAVALVSGARRKASDSFTGRERETERQVRLLAEVRRQAEAYRGEFEKAWTDAQGDVERVEWRDMPGLTAHFRMLIQQGAALDHPEVERIQRLAEKIYRTGDLSGRIALRALKLEASRLERDPEKFTRCFSAFIEEMTFDFGRSNAGRRFYEAEIETRWNLPLRTAADILRDPWARGILQSRLSLERWRKSLAGWVNNCDEYNRKYSFYAEQKYGDLPAAVFKNFFTAPHNTGFGSGFPSCARSPTF